MWNLSPAALKTRRSGKLIFLTVKVRKGKKGETTIKTPAIQTVSTAGNSALTVPYVSTSFQCKPCVRIGTRMQRQLKSMRDLQWELHFSTKTLNLPLSPPTSRFCLMWQTPFKHIVSIPEEFQTACFVDTLQVIDISIDITAKSPLKRQLK